MQKSSFTYAKKIIEVGVVVCHGCQYGRNTVFRMHTGQRLIVSCCSRRHFAGAGEVAELRRSLCTLIFDCVGDGSLQSSVVSS